MNISTGQIKAIGAACAKMRFTPDEKAAIVHSFSGGRCKSSRDLTMAEARELLLHLDRLRSVDPAVKKMRGKIMSIAHELHWTKLNKYGQRVADGKRIDEWAVKYSYLKKKVNQYSEEELPKLVTQFEIFYSKTMNAL